MKNTIQITSFILFFLGCMSSYAQKKLIGNDTYKAWPILKDFGYQRSSILSNDGKYIVYKYGSETKGDFLGVQAINGSYKIDLQTSSDDPIITEDNKKLIFKSPGDSLNILTLGGTGCSSIKDVISFSVPRNGEGQWLAYQMSKPQKEVVLTNLFTRVEKKYESVEEYKFDDKGNTLLIRTNDGIIWVDLTKGTDKQIVSGLKAMNLIFDNSFMQIAFETKRENETEIYYYKSGMASAKVLANNKTDGIGEKYEITNESYPPLQFSTDGSKLFFQLKEKNTTVLATNSDRLPKADVEVMHYRDPFVFEGAESKKYFTEKPIFAVINLSISKVVQLTNHNNTTSQVGNNYVLLQTTANGDEIYWNKEIITLNLVSTDDGKCIKIRDFNGSFPKTVCLSPDEKFVTWFDDKDKQYYSYEIATTIIRNISSAIKFPLFENRKEIVARQRNFGVAGWLPNDSSLLIYDRYDIWKLDPLGRKAPVNLTCSIGRKNNIMFRQINRSEDNFKSIDKDTLLLAGFNPVNKQNGFWTLALKGTNKLEKHTMGDYLYCFPAHTPNYIDYLFEDFPQKAKNANVYVVRRMSAQESPNLFISLDLKNFTPITDIHPEKEYNWLTSELIKWKMPNGKMAEGILYKPENFDPAKKYPVIFHYYEKLSDAINMFPADECGELSSGLRPTRGILNIPWYVSNGYLIFVPNMYFKTGHVRVSVVNTITSAVKHLSTFPWVDIKKLGLQGHSFGGEETAMLIAHTNFFAAAQETAGPVNLTSYYSHRIGGSVNRNSYFDKDQGNLRYSPWERPDLYIENSPVFHVENIHTPLLIVHNKGDDNVPPSQGNELFTALRRLQQPVWLLNYKEEGHTIDNLINQLDFTIRQQQFFDHYLKGKPAPRWMTEGITVTFEEGLQLDSSGRKP
jgi:dienelactone hydrolase